MLSVARSLARSVMPDNPRNRITTAVICVLIAFNGYCALDSLYVIGLSWYVRATLEVLPTDDPAKAAQAREVIQLVDDAYGWMVFNVIAPLVCIAATVPLLVRLRRSFWLASGTTEV